MSPLAARRNAHTTHLCPQPLESRILRVACAAGLHNLTLAPIRPPGSEPLGALMLSRAEPAAPVATAARAAAAALLQHLLQPQVVEGARMVAAVEAAAAPASAVSLLLQVSQGGRIHAARPSLTQHGH